MNNNPHIKRVWGAWVCEDLHIPYTGRRAVGLTPASAYENWKLIKEGGNTMKANYRKYNDRTQNSSTYHKKDGTNVRAILKVQAIKEAMLDKQTK